MEQLRLVDTPQGSISYLLRKRRVKNLNLRLERDGRVVLTVPERCSVGHADRFVEEKAEWIFRTRQKQAVAALTPLPPPPPREECRAMLQAALEKACHLAKPLGVACPELRIRRMKSQWGNCHWQQGYVTLNTALGRCPEHLRVYVALHELVHFVHHDHGPGFYACMNALMPSWKAFRRELRKYVGALEQ